MFIAHILITCATIDALGVTATNTVSALMGLKADGKAWPNVGDEGEFNDVKGVTFHVDYIFSHFCYFMD